MTLSLDKQNILAALIHIRDEGPALPNSGLCCNLESILFPNIGEHGETTAVRKMECWLEKAFKLWPKYSGEEVYPVPSPDKTKTARQAYWTCSEIYWEGEYGALRYELLEFLITQLVEEDRHS